MGIIKKKRYKWLQDAGETVLLVSAGGNVCFCSHLGNHYGGFSNSEMLPCASAISLFIVKDTKSTDHRHYVHVYYYSSPNN